MIISNDQFQRFCSPRLTPRLATNLIRAWRTANISSDAECHAASILHAAIQLCQPAIVRVLLRAGADVNYLDTKGRSPLLYAAAEADLHSSQLLLNHGANANQPDFCGFTALHLAAGHAQYRWGGGLRLVQRLLAAGANPHALARDDLNVADECTHPPTLRLLASLGVRKRLTDED
jgi:ankyrin repeat protein